MKTHWLRNLGQLSLGSLLLIGGGALTGLLILVFYWGISRVAELVLPTLYSVTWIVLAVDLLILVPMTFVWKTKVLAGIGLFISSYVIGLTLWLTSALLVWYALGIWWVVGGLLLGGFGVVPIAMIGSVFKGEWQIAIVLVVMIIATYGFRLWAVFLDEQVTSRDNEALNFLDHQILDKQR